MEGSKKVSVERRLLKVLGVALIMAAIVLFVYAALVGISAIRDKAAENKVEPIEGPTLSREVQKYDPADADYGLPERSDKIEGDFEITVGGCFLRAYPEREEANIYGKLKEECILHVRPLYITVSEGDMTFYGVNASSLTNDMIEKAAGCTATFSKDKDGIVWVAKTYVVSIHSEP